MCEPIPRVTELSLSVGSVVGRSGLVATLARTWLVGFLGLGGLSRVKTGTRSRIDVSGECGSFFAGGRIMSVSSSLEAEYVSELIDGGCSGPSALDLGMDLNLAAWLGCVWAGTAPLCWWW